MGRVRIELTMRDKLTLLDYESSPDKPASGYGPKIKFHLQKNDFIQVNKKTLGQVMQRVQTR